MMEKDILSKVIEVEKEIQERLKEEKKKSLEWLEGVKKESEETLASEEGRLKEFCREAIADTVAKAEAQGAEMVRDSALAAERLGRVNDEILSTILLKYIAAILPKNVSAGSQRKTEESS